MVSLVDSHCHLDYYKEEGEVAAVIARAREAGVGTLVTIGTRISEFAGVRRIAEQFDNVYCTVGIHPHEAASEPAIDRAAIVELARHPKVIGIGETGLDFYYDHGPRDRQAQVFRTHVEAALDAGLPLVVHSRDADPETVAILADYPGVAGLIHCFSTTRVLADGALAQGLSISLSGIVTFKNATLLREIAADIPADRLLVETDAPYLAPVPHRGKRNEPAFVVHTARQVAELRGESLTDLAAATTANFFRLFTKARSPVPA
ncbi:MAG TPA: TatD family hydrolase [Methylomirabilota bacterium]|nr:TatD family hydrolase [Methylomirabilota bacterium]